MTTPLFWLGLSILLVAICLAVVLAVAIPAFLELARAARSAEKLFDTLARDLPPTLEALRLTGLEVQELTDGLGDGVESAGRVVKQVDRSLQETKQQVQSAEITTRSMVTGAKAAWKTLTTPKPPRRAKPQAGQPASDPSPTVPTPEKTHANGHSHAVQQDMTPKGTDSSVS
ncbi:hypothetical protein C1752_06122 [Acaryochloris thomasi RCC1774]|uniref:DUF948 domain-containing protein n=1 Tax=Acaryochloris thomasi RCC1774 TaxID=1764569 RepID=A0A2W1JKN3_9CYAN|nr:hypothetical protein [Acaryochloris thomasi]PZD71502.1 hypothetical protein C1752_06122 [Acaryochloris thomasi RCC1774]